MGRITRVVDWVAGWIVRRGRIRGLLRRLRLELNSALTKARTYLDTTGRGAENTPPYRCATIAYNHGANLLAGYDVFDTAGMEAIEQAYDHILDFNRCLQFVHETIDTPHFAAQVNRARVKAGHVLKSASRALGVVGTALSRFE